LLSGTISSLLHISSVYWLPLRHELLVYECSFSALRWIRPEIWNSLRELLAPCS
jgi:hypothetical protein